MNRLLRLTIALGLPTGLLLVLAVLSLGSLARSTTTDQPAPITVKGSGKLVNIDGDLKAGATEEYRIHGKAGQWLYASILSPQNDVVLSITGADGLILWEEGSVAFWGVLPTTQDYLISARTMRGDSQYTLSYQLDGREDQAVTWLRPVLDSSPVRVEGRMKPGQLDSYTFEALSGQFVLVDAWNTFPNYENLQVMDLVISNADGEALYGGNMLWLGELPDSQRYSVTVIPSMWPEGVGQLDYTLSLGIHTLSEAHEPTRVQFPDNQSVMTMTGSIEPRGRQWGKKRYLVNAVAGQKLDLKLTSENSYALVVSVRGEDGKLLVAGHPFLTGETGFAPDGHTIELPASQDYTISVIGHEGSAFTMQITLLP